MKSKINIYSILTSHTFGVMVIPQVQVFVKGGG